MNLCDIEVSIVTLINISGSYPSTVATFSLVASMTDILTFAVLWTQLNWRIILDKMPSRVLFSPRTHKHCSQEILKLTGKSGLPLAILWWNTKIKENFLTLFAGSQRKKNALPISQTFEHPSTFFRQYHRLQKQPDCRWFNSGHSLNIEGFY